MRRQNPKLRVLELETDEGILEVRVQKWAEKTYFFINLIIVDIDAFFELFLALICFVCINTLKIVHKKS